MCRQYLFAFKNVRVRLFNDSVMTIILESRLPVSLDLSCCCMLYTEGAPLRTGGGFATLLNAWSPTLMHPF